MMVTGYYNIYMEYLKKVPELFQRFKRLLFIKKCGLKKLSYTWMKVPYSKSIKVTGRDVHSFKYIHLRLISVHCDRVLYSL